MDARRSRRTKGKARKAWYAFYRQLRFARWLGFVKVEDDLIRAYRTYPSRIEQSFGTFRVAVVWNHARQEPECR